MNDEYETYADIDGERGPVVVAYEVDRYKPLIYGIFHPETDEDLTAEITEPEFDRIYMEVSQHIIESMTEAAEMTAQGER